MVIDLNTAVSSSMDDPMPDIDSVPLIDPMAEISEINEKVDPASIKTCCNRRVKW